MQFVYILVKYLLPSTFPFAGTLSIFFSFFVCFRFLLRWWTHPHTHTFVCTISNARCSFFFSFSRREMESIKMHATVFNHYFSLWRRICDASLSCCVQQGNEPVWVLSSLPISLYRSATPCVYTQWDSIYKYGTCIYTALAFSACYVRVERIECLPAHVTHADRRVCVLSRIVCGANENIFAGAVCDEDWLKANK